MKMNTEIKTRWVAWLRANADKQGYGYLHKKNEEGESVGFCCLGGLCELAVEDGVVTKVTSESRNGATLTVIGYDGFIAYLPMAVTTWANLKTRNPSVMVNNRTFALSSINDDIRLNFNEIADLIEEQL